MTFIRNVLQEKKDEATHKQFVRYGKGDYERALISIKKGKELKIKTSFDFANDFVWIASVYGKGTLSVKGNIITARDMSEEIEGEHTKRGKLFTVSIEKVMTKEELKKLYEQFKKDFLLLNITGKNLKISVGNKLPRPGGTIKNDFCKATLPLPALEEFLWEQKEFREATIIHVFHITDLVIPSGTSEKDAREVAIRKGMIIRKITLDGKETIVEKFFEA